MLQRLTSRLSDGLDAVLQEDSPSLLTRGYDFGERIWRRARPGARSAPMRLLGHPAAFVRGAEGWSCSTTRAASPAPAPCRGHPRTALRARLGARARRRGAPPPQSHLRGGRVRGCPGRAAHALPRTGVGGGARGLARRRHPDRVRRRRRCVRSRHDAVGGIARHGRGAHPMGSPTRADRRRIRCSLLPAYVEAFANRIFSDRHARRLIEAVRAGDLSAPRARHSPCGPRTATRPGRSCPPRSPAWSCRTASAR